MWVSEELRRQFGPIESFLAASMDPVALVGARGEILYLDLAMKSLLGIKARDLRKRLIFCEVLKLSCCDNGCRITQAIQRGKPLRLADLAASRKTNKLRVSLSVAPWSLGDDSRGALIVVRDTTAEILLQAKYHKLKDLMQDAESELSELRERAERLQVSLRNVRNRSLP